jgi:hypothetical protein
VVSERSLADGKIEIKLRTESDKRMIAADQAAAFIVSIIQGVSPS